MTKLFTRASVTGATLSGANLKTTLTALWDALNTSGVTDASRATVTTSSTLTTTQCGLLLVDATSANVVLTLPTSGAATDDATFIIRRIDSSANAVTVQRGGTDTVEGATAALTVPSNATLHIQMPAGGTNWRVNALSGATAAAARTTISAAVSGANGDITSLTALASVNSGQLAGLRSKIVNGKMDIAQRGTSFAAIANGAYSLDRWQIGNGSAAVSTITQQADAPADNEFQYSLRAAITTADAAIAIGDYYVLQQKIEGYNIRDLINRTFSISFRVKSSKTGIHCIALTNSGLDRSYVMEYTVSVANTWETKTLTVPGGLTTGGTWNYTTGVGLQLSFTLAAGTTYQTTKETWATGNFVATSAQVNCLDLNTNIFAITGVQIEPGAVATPFEHRPYGAELLLCQRYYETGEFGYNGSYQSIGSGCVFHNLFKCTKRATPTMVASGVTSSNLTSPSLNANNAQSYNFGGTATATGTVVYLGAFTAASEL